MEPIFDRTGSVVGWLNRTIIFSDLGVPRAVVKRELIASFASSHLGWLEEGYVLDPDGYAVGWLRRARGGPPTPEPKEPKDWPFLQFAMMPALPTMAPIRPSAARQWSALTWEEFLGNDASRSAVSKGDPPTMEDLAHLEEVVRRERETGKLDPAMLDPSRPATPAPRPLMSSPQPAAPGARPVPPDPQPGPPGRGPSPGLGPAPVAPSRPTAAPPPVPPVAPRLPPPPPPPPGRPPAR